MAETTEIQWCDITWNPAKGCTEASPGCDNCYMMRQANRWGWNGQYVKRTADATFFKPLKYKKTVSEVWGGRPLVFTASLTDVFHVEIDSYRAEIWDIIKRSPNYIFLLLTKRHGRIERCLPPDWGDGYENVWLGVSVENQFMLEKRHKALSKVPAKYRFYSVEPLIDRINIAPYLTGIHWVIVGGESGALDPEAKFKARPMELQWVRDIVAVCQLHNIPVFIKQLGTYLGHTLNLSDKKYAGEINEFPADLQLRQYPAVY